MTPDRPPLAKLQASGLLRDVPLRPAEMRERVTATGDLFMLTHLGLLDIAEADWFLVVSGMVDKALVFSFQDLAEFRHVEIESVHQCAGSPLEPTVATRRVANVIWGGVLLSDRPGGGGRAGGRDVFVERRCRHR